MAKVQVLYSSRCCLLPIPFNKDPFLGNCVLVFRIARDFGDDVLPLYGFGPQNYLVTSHMRTTSRTQWLEILLILRSVIQCVDAHGLPGWTMDMNEKGVVVVLPSTSQMARRWSFDNGDLHGSNGTSIGLVDTS